MWIKPKNCKYINYIKHAELLRVLQNVKISNKNNLTSKTNQKNKYEIADKKDVFYCFFFHNFLTPLFI